MRKRFFDWLERKIHNWEEVPESEIERSCRRGRITFAKFILGLDRPVTY
jgi:hypothetical protein